MSDQLEWKRRTEGEDNWRARNAADDGTYIVYILTEYGSAQIGGVLYRDDQPGLDSESIYSSAVGVGSVAEAKDAAQEHHYNACRARRWADYMRDNEPPKVEPPLSHEEMLRQLLDIKPDPALAAAWASVLKGANQWADKHRKEKP